MRVDVRFFVTFYDTHCVNNDRNSYWIDERVLKRRV